MIRGEFIMKIFPLFVLSLVFCCFVFSAFGQDLRFERSRHKQMLKLVKDDVKKNYFDPAFKGLDIEAGYQRAAEKLEKAESIGQMSGVVAQFLMDFDDSHLFFLPPGKQNKTHYGFRFRMMGDKCLVYHVNKDSDAEKKGLAVGDQIYAIQGLIPMPARHCGRSVIFSSRCGRSLSSISPPSNRTEKRSRSGSFPK